MRKSTPVENIVVHSLIIKRITSRGDDAADTEYKELIDEKHINSLSSKTPAVWQSTPESCEDVKEEDK